MVHLPVRDVVTLGEVDHPAADFLAVMDYQQTATDHLECLRCFCPQ